MMQYKGYVGKVEFDAEAGILHGEVIGIRDVVTFQGSSVKEIEKAFRDSVDDYLALCKERGEQPNRPCSGNFVVRVSPELHRRASLEASARGESLNALVVDCLSKEVGEEARKLTARQPTRRSRIRMEG
jgi:predicted HicB family RNase H-like nuclease